MRWIIADGSEMTARGYTEAVRKMADEKPEEPRSLERYRMACSQRINEMYGIFISTMTDADFIKDLERAGLIRRIPSG